MTNTPNASIRNLNVISSRTWKPTLKSLRFEKTVSLDWFSLARRNSAEQPVRESYRLRVNIDIDKPFPIITFGTVWLWHPEKNEFIPIVSSPLSALQSRAIDPTAYSDSEQGILESDAIDLINEACLIIG